MPYVVYNSVTVLQGNEDFMQHLASGAGLQGHMTIIATNKARGKQSRE